MTSNTPLSQIAPSHPQQIKWNNIYRNKILNTNNHADNTPQACSLLAQHSYLLPDKGQALDLACGQGGNAILMANHGLTVNAWDISDVVIDQLNAQNITNLQANTVDIEKIAPPQSTFDVIIVSCYLHRPLCPALINALKPGGLLFYQTFHQNKLSGNGPSNKKYLLENNELLELFSDLTPLFYQQFGQQGDLNIGERNLASFIGEKSRRNI